MNALFLTFNADYADFAKGAASSFHKFYPDWKVHVLAVNAKYMLKRDAFWSNPYIVVQQYEHKFEDKGLEREHCNSKRFCAYIDWLKLYDKIIATDCDILFKERLTEIEDALDSHDVCMYYNATADPRNRAGASFLAFKGGSSGASALLSTYKKHLWVSGRHWWNDQICLAKAYEELQGTLKAYIIRYEEYCYSGLDVEGMKKCHVIQPRGDKDSPVLQYYRNLLDAELRGACDKVMIVGSGLSGGKVKKWNLDGWHVIVINNAWQLTEDWDELIYPNDFHKLPQHVRQNQKLVTNNIYMPANSAFGVQAERGNTMMFQALYYALLKRPRIIGCVGCDMYYPTTGNTHFYGIGQPDPLRLGNDVLAEKFERFMRNAKELGVELYNFSGETRGLNPFPQKMFQSISVDRRWPKRRYQPKRLHLTGRRPRIALAKA